MLVSAFRPLALVVLFSAPALAFGGTCELPSSDIDQRNANFELERFAREKLSADPKGLVLVVVQDETRERVGTAVVKTEGSESAEVPSSVLSKLTKGRTLRVYKKIPSAVYAVTGERAKSVEKFDPARDCSDSSGPRRVPASAESEVVCETIDLGGAKRAALHFASRADACEKARAPAAGSGS